MRFMKLKKLTDYSAKLLKGCSMSALLVCLMPVGTELFFRLAEAALYSILLYFCEMTPAGLFTGDSLVQQLATLICTVLRYLTTAPLIYATAYWFLQLCGEDKKKRKISLSRIILSPRIYRRSLAALLCSKAVGFLFLIPAAFFGVTAYDLVFGSLGQMENIRLLMAVHAVVMTLISMGLWIWARLAVLATPFLLIQFPDRSVFRIVRDSFRFMKGRRSTILKILAMYVPPMLLLVTVPFLLPKLFSAISLCISIALKEDEYLEGNKANSEFGQACRSSKLSVRSKRRFTPSADKA